MATSSSSLRGKLLVASPELLDPNFMATVVLLIEHNADGALGVVLNRPIEKTIADVWQEIGEPPTSCQAPLFWGGPVTSPLLLVHAKQPPGGQEVIPGVYFASDRKQIDQLMAQNDASMRFFVGCAGWGSGQLEQEIHEGSWKIIPARAHHVMKASPELWKRIHAEREFGGLWKNLGVKNVPIDPSQN